MAASMLLTMRREQGILIIIEIGAGDGPSRNDEDDAGNMLTGTASADVISTLAGRESSDVDSADLHYGNRGIIYGGHNDDTVLSRVAAAILVDHAPHTNDMLKFNRRRLCVSAGIPKGHVIASRARDMRNYNIRRTVA